MDHSNKEQISRAKRYVAKLQDYKAVFSSDAGKRVLYDLMKHGHMLESAYVQGDPHETSFREGERNIALMVLKKLQTDLDGLRKHIEEGDAE